MAPAIFFGWEDGDGGKCAGGSDFTLGLSMAVPLGFGGSLGALNGQKQEAPARTRATKEQRESELTAAR